MISVLLAQLYYADVVCFKPEKTALPKGNGKAAKKEVFGSLNWGSGGAIYEKRLSEKVLIHYVLVEFLLAADCSGLSVLVGICGQVFQSQLTLFILLTLS